MKNLKSKTAVTTPDLPETIDDKIHLQPDEGTLDLPDVGDIPGQEHIHVPSMREFADTTISSDDEEGVGILDNEDEDEIGDTINGNVSKEEKKTLKDASEKMPSADEETLVKARLDQLDDEGESLNEQSDLSGSDLDVPGSEDDDVNEEIGEEDEENNSYSQDGEHEDNNDAKQ